MPTTYEPIATTTLGSAATTITFSSIPATYTDLKVVFVGNSTTGNYRLNGRVNGDTGTNYSATFLRGTGAAAQSARVSSQDMLYLTNNNIITTNLELSIIDIFSYAGSTFKTILCSNNSDQNGSGIVENSVNLWRSTSAITSFSLSPEFSTSTFNAGTTATLYGIKNA
jgi:hypothetical protein